MLGDRKRGEQHEMAILAAAATAAEVAPLLVKPSPMDLVYLASDFPVRWGLGFGRLERFGGGVLSRLRFVAACVHRMGLVYF